MMLAEGVHFIKEKCSLTKFALLVIVSNSPEKGGVYSL